MNLRDRARKLFGRDTLSEHSVVASKVEHAVFNDVRKRSTAISDVIDTPPLVGESDVLDGKVWERMADDLWSEFYGSDEPTLRARDKIDQRFRINRALADKTARDESFSEMHAKTRGDRLASSLATLGALSEIREHYTQELSEHAKRANEIADSEDHLDSLDEEMAALREQRRELQGDPSAIDDKMRQLAASKRAEQEALSQALAEQQAHAGDMADAVAKVAAKAADAAQEAVRTAALLKGTQDGPGGIRSVEQALAFADRISKSRKLKRVLELLGRMEISMGTVRRQMRKGGYEEMVDIELGNDLRNVLPSEKVLLMHPAGKFDFFRRYCEQSLTQYEMWSEEEQKKGPIIVAGDGSDSMRGAPDEFCRGLCMNCVAIANSEHRNAAAIEFSADGQMREFWFPAGNGLDMARLMDFAEHFYAGGTDINQVLERAAQMIDEEAPFHSADLIIVTDGGDHVTERTIELRDHLRSMGVKIHGLAINSHPTPYLLEVCDNVNAVWEFDGPNDASDRLAIDLT